MAYGEARGAEIRCTWATLDARDRELPCDPDAAEELTGDVFGEGRADDLAHWRKDGGAGPILY